MVAIPLKMVFNFYNTLTTSREREIGSLSMNEYNDYLKNLGNFSLKFDQILTIENLKKHMHKRCPHTLSDVIGLWVNSLVLVNGTDEGVNSLV